MKETFKGIKKRIKKGALLLGALVTLTSPKAGTEQGGEIQTVSDADKKGNIATVEAKKEGIIGKQKTISYEEAQEIEQEKIEDLQGEIKETLSNQKEESQIIGEKEAPIIERQVFVEEGKKERQATKEIKKVILNLSAQEVTNRLKKMLEKRLPFIASLKELSISGKKNEFDIKAKIKYGFASMDIKGIFVNKTEEGTISSSNVEITDAPKWLKKKAEESEGGLEGVIEGAKDDFLASLQKEYNMIIASVHIDDKGNLLIEYLKKDQSVKT